jgi:diguanylate cyclase (GGDEF)-like protein
MGVKKNSILIVDDETINLMALTQILSDDYKIYTAINGKIGIEKAKELLPDLILLDIMMPEIDGYQVLAEIKKTEELRNTPVIFISGLTSDEDEEKGLTLDAADYIKKPFRNTVVKIRVKNQIQIVNQLRTIECLSLMDQLTNIPNRRSFDCRMKVLWKQAIRNKTPISLLMMDLDRFKQVNDDYGHQQGDVVLKTVANVLSQFLRRPNDFAARWGGEEFIIILPDTPIDGALEVAENIRKNVEDTLIPRVKFKPGDRIADEYLCEIKPDGTELCYPGLKITISIGVTSLVPGQKNSSDTFIYNADKALYLAKDAGRNRVMSVC